MSARYTSPTTGFAVVEVIRHFERLGVFEALETPTTVSQLAERLALPLRSLELTLPLLTELRYLERQGDTFRCVADQEGVRETLPELASFLTSGGVGDQIDRKENRGAYYSDAVLGLGRMFEHDAKRLAAKLRPVDSIVDIGAGSAVWSLAMAARSGGRVTAVDLPEVVPGVPATAELMGIRTPPEIVAGDYFEVVVEGPVDRVVMANMLHLESAEDAQHLVQKYAKALAPNGELVIVDVMGGGDFERRLWTATYALHLGMRTKVGRPHAERDLRTWCADAGLTEQRVVRLPSAGLSALISSAEPTDAPEREETTIAVEELSSLRESSETLDARFRMVFEGAADPIMFVDKQARAIVMINPAFRSLFEVDWPSVRRTNLEEVVAPEDLSRCRDLIIGLAEGRVTERHHTLRMLRQGRTFNAELAAFDPLARSFIGFTVRDRDRLVRTERLQALGELVGGLSHDLNTPLGILKSNCGLASRLVERLSPADDAEAKVLVALERATRDAQTAIEQVTRRLDAIKGFATLEGPALKALSPHFTSGLALAICQRAAEDA